MAAKPFGIAGKLIPVLMAGMLLFGLPGCRSEGGQLATKPMPDTFAKSPQPTHPEGLGGDGSYEHFMDSIIVRKDIVYDTTSIKAGEVWLWDEQEGAYSKEPKTFHFGSTYFDMTTRMDVVNEEGDRQYHIRYETDTAYLFYFKGRKYGWARAYYYNCNGSGCLEEYYLLGDFRNKRLHVFVTMAVPDYNNYFGDLDGDDQLDVLLPSYAQTASSQLPYSDTTEVLLLTPYSLNKKGHFVKRMGDKSNCAITGQFDHGNFAPTHFHIIRTTCPF